jgi:hypothetical protein
MFNALTALGYGVITFAIVIGIGAVVLNRFAGAVASCGNTTTVGDDGYGIWNTTANECSNATANTGAPTNTAYTNVNYFEGQLGTTGLAGWTPAVIAFAVGMLFLGAFLVGKGGRHY